MQTVFSVYFCIYRFFGLDSSFSNAKIATLSMMCTERSILLKDLKF